MTSKEKRGDDVRAARVVVAAAGHDDLRAVGQRARRRARRSRCATSRTAARRRASRSSKYTRARLASQVPHLAERAARARASAARRAARPRTRRPGTGRQRAAGDAFGAGHGRATVPPRPAGTAPPTVRRPRRCRPSWTSAAAGPPGRACRGPRRCSRGATSRAISRSPSVRAGWSAGRPSISFAIRLRSCSAKCGVEAPMSWRTSSTVTSWPGALRAGCSNFAHGLSSRTGEISRRASMRDWA